MFLFIICYIVVYHYVLIIVIMYDIVVLIAFAICSELLQKPRKFR